MFYFADFKTEAKKSDNALVAGLERYLGDKKNSEASSQKKNLSQKPSLLAPNISEKAAAKDEQAVSGAHSRANLADMEVLFDEAKAKGKIKIGGEKAKFEENDALNSPKERDKFDKERWSAPKIKDKISLDSGNLASRDTSGLGETDVKKGDDELNSSNLRPKSEPVKSARNSDNAVKFDASRTPQRTHIFANSEAVIFDDTPMFENLSQTQTQNQALERTLKNEKIHIEFSDANDAANDQAGQVGVKFNAENTPQSAESSEKEKDEKKKAKKEGEAKFAGSNKSGKKAGAEIKAAVKAGSKPRLVIIIDDVAYRHQADAIRSVNLKLTPSFFPSTSAHPETPILARRFSFYMIHLPMQALGGFKGAEIGTLTINDDYEKIAKKLQSIKRDFPDLKYINNHTGSRFTSDAAAMDRLMRAVRDENLIFVDSKTTSPTKVYGAAKKYSMPYIARDVFLDHDGSKAAVRKKLKYAVELAKKRSYAIAIGHPHKNTLEVLRESAKLLQEVEIVYLKDLF